VGVHGHQVVVNNHYPFLLEFLCPASLRNNFFLGLSKHSLRETRASPP
jgi:hypothetical protein